MRATDDRYRGERAKFELAMRMIGHEARTGTIRYWTGLSDDRIRKLYTTYFKFNGNAVVKRRRGRSPTQIAPLVSTPVRTLETGVFTHLLMTNGLLSADQPPGPRLSGNIDLGHRFCQCFETHRLLLPAAELTFEWAWNLLACIRRGDELTITRCANCSIAYVLDLLALPKAACPACWALARTDRVALA